MKYEYKTMAVQFGPLKDDALNKLGADGWRLINVHVGQDATTVVFQYIFIREKR